MKTIRKGDAGSDVKAWQQVLIAGSKPTSWTNAAGKPREWSAQWKWPIAADGAFGERTEFATEAWQASHSLVADGIVGPKSWDAAGAVTDATRPPVVDSDSDPGAHGIEFIEAKNYTRGRRQSVRLLVVHTMENQEMHNAARGAASWFAVQPARGTLVDARVRPDPNGRPWGGSSAHYCIDANEIVQSVREGDTAWHAGAVNDYSIGLEHAGTAKQTAKDWEDDFSTRTLLRSAAHAAELCIRYRIRPVQLTLDELKAGKDGFCGHVDSTNAFGPVGGHTDPGTNFPWDRYIAEVKRQMAKLEGGAFDPAPPPNKDGDTAAEAGWVEVTHANVKWLVASNYIGPVGIGEATELARKNGCVLPTPDLVDAIYAKADRKIDATKLVRSDFKQWSMAEMGSPTVIAQQLERITGEIGDKSFTLVAGTFKDVVQHKDGRIGLYGWHRANGTPIQPFYAGHAASWKDYSQGLRLVKRA